MFIRAVLVKAAAGLLLLSACAAPPEPEPILAEPAFNKYGEPLCRPAQQPVNSIYPPELPICEEFCENGVPVAGAPEGIVCPPATTTAQRPNRGSPSDPVRGQGTAAGMPTGC